jgi:hypothetical protein
VGAEPRWWSPRSISGGIQVPASIDLRNFVAVVLVAVEHFPLDQMWVGNDGFKMVNRSRWDVGVIEYS